MEKNFPKLEKYTIIKILGEGGMGYVYLAEHKKIGRLVAIKMLHSNMLRDPLVRERFKREAALLAKLQHPNIVVLYDYEEHPEGLYLIMEYIEGEVLSNILINKGPIPLDKAKKYFIQILDAFQYAHKKGIIHRDIKPSNIMINTEDNIKILDFGIGKLANETQNQSITSTGIRLGTLMYMAPEQIETGEVSIQTDIYSLGLTFFQMLTAHYPYPKNQFTDFQLSTKIVNEPFPPENHPYNNIPEPLFYAFKKAIEKNPNNRYNSCEEFKQAILEAYEMIESEKPTISEDDIDLILIEEDNNKKNNPLITPTTTTEIQIKPEKTTTIIKQDKKKKNIIIPAAIASFLILIIISSIVVIINITSKKENENSTQIQENIIQDSIQTLTIVKPPSYIDSINIEQESENNANIQKVKKRNKIIRKKYNRKKIKKQETKDKNQETTTNNNKDILNKIDKKLKYSKFSKFLHVEAKHKRKILNKFQSDIQVKNSADIPYNNIMFKLIYKDKDGSIINTKTYSFIEEVPANGSKAYQIKHKAPPGTAKIEVKLIKANPILSE